jgi:hypothetical protein
MRVNLGKYGGKYQESLIGPPFRTNSCRFMGEMIRNPRYGCQRPLKLEKNRGNLGKNREKWGVFGGVFGVHFGCILAHSGGSLGKVPHKSGNR